MMNGGDIVKLWTTVVVVCFKVVTWHSPGETEEHPVKHRSG
jgi:hypothetical protein